MHWDYETLRTIRKNRFSSIKAFSEASCIAKDAISNVENGYSATRLSTIKRYCSALDLEISKHVFEVGAEPQFGFIKLVPPNAIDFRPVSQPTPDNQSWTSFRTVISLLPFSVSVPNSIPEAVCINSATLHVSCLTDNQGSSLSYFSLYWVALDNSHSSDSMPRSTAWRGEVDRFGSGATVQPFYVQPGKKDVREMMFNCSQSPSWKSFVSELSDLGDADLSCDLSVDYSIAGSRHGTQKCHFHIPCHCIRETMERIKQVPTEKYSCGQVAYIKLNTKEGRYERCFENCCSGSRGK